MVGLTYQNLHRAVLAGVGADEVSIRSVSWLLTTLHRSPPKDTPMDHRSSTATSEAYSSH